MEASDDIREKWRLYVEGLDWEKGTVFQKCCQSKNCAERWMQLQKAINSLDAKWDEDQDNDNKFQIVKDRIKKGIQPFTECGKSGWMKKLR